MKKKIFNVCILLLIQALSLSGIVWARGKADYEQACLSPVVKIGNAAFEKLYQVRIDSISGADTILQRRDFEEDIFNFHFKTIFPARIQAEILNAILGGSHAIPFSRDQISKISVKFNSSNDPYTNEAYSYFKKLGEENLDRLSDEVGLKNHLLDAHYELDGSYYELDKSWQQRNWFIRRITQKYGAIEESLKDKSLLGIERKYYEVVLQHKFGDTFLGLLKRSGAKFDVVITLEDDRELSGTVVINGNEGRIVGQMLGNGSYSENEAVPKHEKFGKLRSTLRREMHKMENQKEDIKYTLENMIILQRIRDIDIEEIVFLDQETIRQQLVSVDSWSEYKRGRHVDLKDEVHKYLGSILGERGEFIRGDFRNMNIKIKEAIKALKVRIGFLRHGINGSNDLLFKESNIQENNYLYLESIRNMLFDVEVLIRLREEDNGLLKLKKVESLLLKHNAVWEKLKGHPFFQQRLSDMIKSSEDRAYVYKLERALGLIGDVDQYIKNQAHNLSEISAWLKGRGLSRTSAQVNLLINELIDIKTRKENYNQVITGVMKKIGDMIKRFRKLSRENKKMKGLSKILIPRIAAVHNSLGLTRNMIAKRDQIIKDMLMPEEILGTIDEVAQLFSVHMEKIKTSQESGQKFMESLENLALSLALIQDEFSVDKEVVIEKTIRNNEIMNEYIYQAI
ncbi:MAG: hypothetical protein GY853_07935 [PVC group bacterium]|nr:hypothetical protein [PVC group bacterium]